MLDRKLVLRLLVALLAFAGAGISSGRSEGVNGMIGAPLATAQERTDFFRFFHLERVDEPAQGVVDFRPSGGKFRDLVRVRVIIDGQGAITAMSLVLMRAFIDDPALTLFARDIAQSFLRDAPGREDAARLADLAEDIATRGRPSGPVIVGPNFRRASGEPSLDYAVFTGARPGVALRSLARTTFSMEPIEEKGQQALELTLVVRPTR